MIALLLIRKEAELIGIFPGRLSAPGDLRHPDLVEFTLFHVPEDLHRPRDHLSGNPGDPRHLDAVAPVRPPLHDLPEKNDPVPPLPDGDVEIPHPLLRDGKFRQFVIMGGEERPRPERRGVVDIFRHRPGDAEAVEGARPPSHLVEDDQAPLRGMTGGYWPPRSSPP